MDDVWVNVLWAVIIFADVMIDAVIMSLIFKPPLESTTTLPANMTLIIHRLGHLMIRPN